MWEIALTLQPILLHSASWILWKWIVWRRSDMLHLYIFLIRVSSQRKKRDVKLSGPDLCEPMLVLGDHCCLFQQLLRLLQEPLQTCGFVFLSLWKIKTMCIDCLLISVRRQVKGPGHVPGVDLSWVCGLCRHFLYGGPSYPAFSLFHGRYPRSTAPLNAVVTHWHGKCDRGNNSPLKCACSVPGTFEYVILQDKRTLHILLC